MFSNSHSAAANQHGSAPSIISSDVVITGILQSDGDIQIDGRVEGNVRSAGLVIGERAVIHGEIQAEHVVVRGRVEGGIRAREVTLAAGSHVQGDILHENLEVEFGAFVEGIFRHSPDPLAPALLTADVEAEEMVDRRRPGSPMRQAEPQEAARIDDIRKTA
jgi:cytoskeletal protein CcmA (bactofilin family)